MKNNTIHNQVRKLLVTGAVIIIMGIFLSGPPLVFLIEYLLPQPNWIDVPTFVSHFHWLQTLPYWFGFILMVGNILFIAAISKFGHLRESILAPTALVCVAIYGALVSINYALQTTFVPAAVLQKNQALATFSMVNPGSVCWTLEMFGYAFLGIAYALVAPAFSGSRILRSIKYLMIFNGIVSVLGVFIPAIDPTLLLASGGLIGYTLWNVLIVVIMVLIIIAYSSKR